MHVFFSPKFASGQSHRFWRWRQCRCQSVLEADRVGHFQNADKIALIDGEAAICHRLRRGRPAIDGQRLKAVAFALAGQPIMPAAPIAQREIAFAADLFTDAATQFEADVAGGYCARRWVERDGFSVRMITWSPWSAKGGLSPSVSPPNCALINGGSAGLLILWSAAWRFCAFDVHLGDARVGRRRPSSVKVSTPLTPQMRTARRSTVRNRWAMGSGALSRTRNRRGWPSHPSSSAANLRTGSAVIASTHRHGARVAKAFRPAGYAQGGGGFWKAYPPWW